MTSQPTPPAMPQTPEQQRTVAYTRSGHSAFGVAPVMPASPAGGSEWVAIGPRQPGLESRPGGREEAKYAPKEPKGR